MSKEISSSEELIDAYVEDALLQGLSEGTLETYRSNISYFFAFTGLRPDEVDKHVLKNFLHHLRNEKSGRRGKENGVAQNTINAYFSALSSFYEFAVYEDHVPSNPIPAFRSRYLKSNRNAEQEDRQLISVGEMAGIIKSILKTRDEAIYLVLAKTGVRRGELIRIDIDDIDWERQSIKLKPTPKRDNRTVFFDDETNRVLAKWVEIREDNEPNTDGLFINQSGGRLKRHGVYRVVTNHAERLGIHDPDSNKLEERFTPHCTRHWFTTHLRRSGMKREFIKELRGDAHDDAMDSYIHIDKEELRESYLTHIPRLGI